MLPSFVRHVEQILPSLKKYRADDVAADAELGAVCGWLLGKQNDRDQTVQSWLSKIQAKSRLENFLAQLNTDLARKKWFIDLQTLEAGLWLRDVPKRGKGLSNEEMRAALRLRLYLPVCGFVIIIIIINFTVRETTNC